MPYSQNVFNIYSTELAAPCGYKRLQTVWNKYIKIFLRRQHIHLLIHSYYTLYICMHVCIFIIFEFQRVKPSEGYVYLLCIYVYIYVFIWLCVCVCSSGKRCRQRMFIWMYVCLCTCGFTPKHTECVQCTPYVISSILFCSVVFGWKYMLEM